MSNVYSEHPILKFRAPTLGGKEIKQHKTPHNFYNGYEEQDDFFLVLSHECSHQATTTETSTTITKKIQTEIDNVKVKHSRKALERS